MSDKNARIDNLPPTTAGLNRALTILAQSTGCPDCEAERLLSQWDALNRRYTDRLGRDPLPIRTGDQVYQQVAML
jgi:hypothetical protein